MPAFYTYLISSLPMLNFNGDLPFTLEDFFLKCKGLIPEDKAGILRDVSNTGNFLELPKIKENSTLSQWLNFEIALRNELVRARGARTKIDPAKYIRNPDNQQAHISHVALTAYRNTSILGAEKILDQERWNFLDSLSFGHYFDFDFLLIYVLKLKILKRWDKVNKADKEALFNNAVLN